MLSIFIPLVLFLGIVTSHEDIRSGKIKNKHIVFALAYSLVGNMALIIAYDIDIIPDIYYRQYVINFLISSIFGFLLYVATLWSAGDGKIFLAYAALIPLSVYKHTYLPYFPSFSIFINTFLLGFCFIIAKFLFETPLKSKLIVLRQMMDPRAILSIVIYVFGFLWPIRLLLSYFNLSNTILFIVAILLIARLIQSISALNINHLAMVLAALRLATNMGNLEPLFHQILFLIPIVIIFQFLNLTASFVSQKSTKIMEIEPGMVLAEKIAESNGIYSKQPSRSGFPSISDQQDATSTSKGISLQYLKEIQGLCKSGSLGFDDIQVRKMLPFAPLIFGGVLLTIIANGNIIQAF